MVTRLASVHAEEPFIGVDEALEGHCHSFAVALHRITGWPLWGAWKTSDDGDEDGRLVHIAVEHPDGQLIDANGKAPVREREQLSQILGGGDERWEYETIGGEADLAAQIAADSKSVWRPMRTDAAQLLALAAAVRWVPAASRRVQR